MDILGGLTVKCLALGILVLLAGLFLPTEVLAQQEVDSNEAVTESSEQQVNTQTNTAPMVMLKMLDRLMQQAPAESNQPQVTEETGPRGREDANAVTPGLEFLGDADAVKSKLQQHEGLEKKIENLAMRGRVESREWVNENAEDQFDLAHAVHRQAVDEFLLLRKLAADEGAEKTVAAIDGVLLERDKRYRLMFRRMAALKERADRDGRGRDRYEEDDRYGRDRRYDRRTRGRALQRPDYGRGREPMRQRDRDRYPPAEQEDEEEQEDQEDR